MQKTQHSFVFVPRWGVILGTLLLAMAATAHAEPHRSDAYSVSFVDSMSGVQGFKLRLGETEDQALAAFRQEIAWCPQRRVEVQGQPFALAERIEIPQKPAQPWSVQYNARNRDAVRRGQWVGWSYFARSPEAGSMQVKVDGQGFRETVDLGNDWRRYTHHFLAKRDYAPGELKFNYFFGTAAHTVELGGVLVFTASAEAELGSFPEWARPPRASSSESPPKSPRAQRQPPLVPGEWIPDEASVEVTLHVDAASDTPGNGGADRPFASAAAAMERAKRLLREGKGVRVRLAPGVYRESLGALVGGRENQAFVGSVLVIEADAPETVFFRGSKVLDAWRLVPDHEGVWRHHWDEPVEIVGGVFGRYNPPNVIAHRRELLFVDGVPMSPVLLEEYAYTPKTKAAKGSGEHKHLGTLPLTNLVDGSFGVRDGINDSQPEIYLRPPAGVDPNETQVEVAHRSALLYIHGKRNVVLRNLVFEQTAGIMEQPAVRIGKSPPFWDFHSNSYLIENCRFDHNNGAGLTLDTVSDVTLRDCTFNDNGFKGLKLIYVHNSVFEGVEISRNNWRGGRDMGGGYWWAEAGMKSWKGYNNVFRDWTMVANQGRGFWFDGNHEYMAIDGLVVTDHPKVGIDFEISRGPITLTNALSMRNDAGLIVNNSQDVTITDSQFIDNRSSQIELGGRLGGRSTDGLGRKTNIIFLRDLTLSDNVVAITRDHGASLFAVQRQATTGVAMMGLSQESGSVFTRNRFYHAAGPTAPAFFLDPRHGDLAAFEERYGLSGNRFEMSDLEPSESIYEAVRPDGSITLIPGRASVSREVAPLNDGMDGRFAVVAQTPAVPDHDAPHLSFRTRFDEPGAHYLWARVRGDAPRLHARLDGRRGFADTVTQGTPADPEGWRWVRLTDSSQPAALVVEGPAIRRVDLWLESPGLELDRVWLTRDAQATPADADAPHAVIELNGAKGYAPFNLAGSAERSLGRLTERHWLLDGEVIDEGTVVTRLIDEPGQYQITLRVVDSEGRSHQSVRDVVVLDPTLVRWDVAAVSSEIKNTDRLINGVMDDRHHSWFPKRGSGFAVIDLGQPRRLDHLRVSVSQKNGDHHRSEIELGWSMSREDRMPPSQHVTRELLRDGRLHLVELPDDVTARFIYIQSGGSPVRVGEIEAWGWTEPD